MSDVIVRQLRYDSGKCFVCGKKDVIVESESRDWVERECMNCDYSFRFDKIPL